VNETLSVVSEHVVADVEITQVTAVALPFCSTVNVKLPVTGALASVTDKLLTVQAGMGV
jgi:hypothetical protein